MEEEYDREVVPTGEGNQKLGAICEGLFYKTGEPMLYCMSQRLIENPQQFDENFAPQTEQDMGMGQQ